MKRHQLILMALLVIIAAFAFTKVHHTEKAGINSGFALVELYTSEGCSSCPPADKLLAKVQQEYAGKEVYVLAYHVDYWNHLGWKDVFSNAQYSQRQRNYSNYLKLDGVYTPQAIVNGKAEFVGSDERKMTTAIQQGLDKPAPDELAFASVKLAGGRAQLSYRVSGITSNSSLVLAVVQKHAQTQVKAGENSGRMLPHINIVQKLQTVNLKNAIGNADVSLPDGFNAKDWSIIGFVQNNRDGAILAVAKATVDGKEMAAIN